MVCLGLKSGAAGWKVQTNPLSYGGTLMLPLLYLAKVLLLFLHKFKQLLHFCLRPKAKYLVITRVVVVVLGFFI